MSDLNLVNDSDSEHGTDMYAQFQVLLRSFELGGDRSNLTNYFREITNEQKSRIFELENSVQKYKRMSHAGAEKVSSLYEIIRQKDNEIIHAKAESEKLMR